MAEEENNISNDVRIACGKIGIKLWRNNVGYDAQTKTKYGLKKGSADWIGVLPMVVTHEMVGKVVGVFVSIETKTIKGRMSDDGLQQEWLDNRIKDGCIAVVARSVADVPSAWKFPNLEDCGAEIFGIGWKYPPPLDDGK